MGCFLCEAEEKMLLAVGQELCNIWCSECFGFSWKLESIFLQNSPSFQLTETTVLLLFLWRKSFCYFIFQARDNENYEPLICLYSVNNTYWWLIENKFCFESSLLWSCFWYRIFHTFGLSSVAICWQNGKHLKSESWWNVC